METKTYQTGRIHLPEISGIEALPGDRLALVSDEQSPRLADDVANQLEAGRVRPHDAPLLDDQPKSTLNLEDLEDACWDGAGLILAASHSRNKHGEAEQDRCRLARVKLNDEGEITAAAQSAGLYWAIQDKIPYLARAALDPPARGGLNIEGAAWRTDKEHLVLGLRSPTLTRERKDSDARPEGALILCVKNPKELFEDPDEPAELKTFNGEPFLALDLEAQGIRGMCYDPGRELFWILSGLSADPNHPVSNVWALWSWQWKSKPRKIELPADVPLARPEAICQTKVDGADCLLIVEERDAGCNYVLIPEEDLD